MSGCIFYIFRHYHSVSSPPACFQSQYIFFDSLQLLPTIYYHVTLSSPFLAVHVLGNRISQFNLKQIIFGSLFQRFNINQHSRDFQTGAAVAIIIGSIDEHAKGNIFKNDGNTRKLICRNGADRKETKRTELNTSSRQEKFNS